LYRGISVGREAGHWHDAHRRKRRARQYRCAQRSPLAVPLRHLTASPERAL